MCTLTKLQLHFININYDVIHYLSFFYQIAKKYLW